MNIIIFLLFFLSFVYGEPASAEYELTLTKDLISYSLSNGKIKNGNIDILPQNLINEIANIPPGEDGKQDIAILKAITGDQTINTNDINALLKINEKLKLDITKLYKYKYKGFADCLNRIIEDCLNFSEITEDINFKNSVKNNVPKIKEGRFGAMNNIYNNPKFSNKFTSFIENCIPDLINFIFVRKDGEKLNELEECYTSENDKKNLKKRGLKLDDGHYNIIKVCKRMENKFNFKC